MADQRTTDTIPMRPHERTGMQVEPGEAEHDPDRGDTIGRFIVLGVLGSGGMGVVYSAYDPQLDRKVAIKLLHTDELAKPTNVRTRLLREAQAMARIDHPNVIKVHEVGTHGEGVYVAMEFAEAGTVRAWLKQQPRSRDEVIDIYLQAGRGLAAAHSAGLIHRDFKPDNVLMTRGGVVRVTDFGLVSEQDEHEVATPTEPFERPPEAGTRATPLSLELTRTGSLVGTPPYMAPEQFKLGVSTARSDQFSFCVALYEGLYGERPFSGTTFEEVSANVTSGQFSPPPTEISLPRWLKRIVMRGLATDPDARFPSMAALLAELSREGLHRRRRYLAWAGAPLLAAAAATAYAAWPSKAETCRAGGTRFAAVWNAARRQQLETAFLASGRPLAPAWFAKVTEIVDAWGRDWQQGYVAACEDTRVRGERSEHVLDLRMDCLAHRLDETQATLGLLATGGGDAIDHALDAVLQLPRIAPCADVPALEAAVPPPETTQQRAQVEGVRGQLDEVIAEERLGRILAARDLAATALVAARISGYRPILADALIAFGSLQLELADHAASDTLREAMHVAAEAGDPARQLEATSYFVLAAAGHREQFELGTELAALGEAAVAHAAPLPETFLRLEAGRARIEQALGKLDSAQATLENAIAFADRDGRGSMLDGARNALGAVLVAQGKYDAAAELIEKSIDERQRRLGSDHPVVAASINNLAMVYRRQGKLAEAKQLDDRALAIRIAAYGPDHPEVGASYNNLGTSYLDEDDFATAEGYLRKAIEVWVKAYGADSAEVARAYDNLGCALTGKGQRAEARVQLEHALAIFQAAGGVEDERLATPLSHLADLEKREGHLDRALALLRRAEDIATTARGPDHPDIPDYIASEASVLRAQHKLVEAETAIARSIAVMEKAYGADHPMVGRALVNLGNIQSERNDARAALASYDKARAILEARFGKNHPLLAMPLLGMANSLATLGRAAEAAPHLERALALRTAAHASPGDLAQIHFALAGALIAAPATRARAIAEAKLALAGLGQSDRGDDAAEVRRWLAQHSL